MSGVGDCAQRAQVVDPVQLGLAVGGVEAAEEEVDGIGLAGAEGVGELETGPGGSGGGTEGKVVAVWARWGARQRSGKTAAGDSESATNRIW